MAEWVITAFGLIAGFLFLVVTSFFACAVCSAIVQRFLNWYDAKVAASHRQRVAVEMNMSAWILTDPRLAQVLLTAARIISVGELSAEVLAKEYEKDLRFMEELTGTPGLPLATNDE